MSQFPVQGVPETTQSAARLDGQANTRQRNVGQPDQASSNHDSTPPKDADKTVFAVDKVSRRIWLNVINQSTGKIVQELPPETIRKILDSLSTRPGSLFDQTF